MMLKPSVEVHDVDGVLVAEFWECLRLDPAPVSELREIYDRHVQRGGLPSVAVDLSGVGFSGSAALGHLVALHRKARQNGGRLVLCNVDPTVHEVLRASQLGSLFDMASNREAALAAIAKLQGSDNGTAADLEAGLLPREKPSAASASASAPLRRRRAGGAS